MFSAIIIDKNEGGHAVSVQEIDEVGLPAGNVTVDVAYSSLNFKDAIAITATSPVVRGFPMVPGIDLAGIVRTSEHPDYKSGDNVLLNGWGVGESHWGGLAQVARLDGDWLMPLPDAFSHFQAMAIGTAGYTAALSVEALVRHGIMPEQGDILVTGATGGVGSVAIALLAKAGFSVVAATGKASETDYLVGLGAASVMDRSHLAAHGKPLQKERWAGVIDALGSTTLANACAQTSYGGVVVACGLAQGADFPATIMPFILRSVTLVGIDSVMAPKTARLAAWARLARDLDPALISVLSAEIALAEAISTATAFIEGTVRGRIVVDVNR